jgi:hypothetical protein
VSRIHCRNGRITGVSVGKPDGPKVTGDYYIAALPVEVMRAPLVTDAIRDADPTFGSLHRLKTRWMNGVLVYLREDIPQIRGHTIYVDTPWALTSISQRQFWKEGLAGMGDGQARGIISVDVSDWKSGPASTMTRSSESTTPMCGALSSTRRSPIRTPPRPSMPSRC